LSDGGTFGCGRLRRAFSPVASGVGGHATGVLGLATAALCLAVCLGLRPSVGAPHRSSDLPLAQTFRNGSGYRPLLLHSVNTLYSACIHVGASIQCIMHAFKVPTLCIPLLGTRHANSTKRSRSSRRALRVGGTPRGPPRPALRLAPSRVGSVWPNRFADALQRQMI
jgi:hypothetical protein